MSDSILLRIARGERAAVAECIDRHGGLVWSLARRACGDRTEAEDAVQEIFIELWTSAGRYDPALASETTFVAMIARRRLIDRRRKSSRRPGADSLPAHLAGDSADPGLSAEVHEEAERARQALNLLREEERLVLNLSLGGGQTYDQISKITSLPLGTVKSHARRGLIRLRELLGAAPAPAPAPAKTGALTSRQEVTSES